MDASTLSDAMWGTVSDERYAALCPAFNAAMLAAGCTTVDRAAMWCAQLGHESNGLLWMEELASGAAYNGRADLGNTQPGDGPRFKGRGPIQLTGRSNYTRCSLWAFDLGLVPTRTFLVDHPTQAASDQYGFIGAVWYWTVARNMNAYADDGDIRGGSIAVNGGTNGLADRINRWNHCRSLGARLLPEEGFLMALSEQEQREILEGARQLKPFGSRKVAAEFNPDGSNWSAQALHRVALELAQRYPSRSRYRDTNDAVDTLAGYILNIDAREHEAGVERAALAGDSLAIAKVKKAADTGDAIAKSILAKIGAK